jgi:sulfide:quinone oxidoreductase
VRALDPARRVAILDDERELPYDLFLGIPKHRVPDVVAASGLTENGWIPVNPKNLKTRFRGVYAIGDVTSVGTPKAGVFAEGAARIVAASLIADVQGGDRPPAYAGAGSCYVEFGAERVGRVDVDFLRGLRPRESSSSLPLPSSPRSSTSIQSPEPLVRAVARRRVSPASQVQA